MVESAGIAPTNISLSELPDCPRQLSDAAARGRLVIFIGAGFSRLAGSPGWEDFANAVLNFLARKGVLLESEMDQLKRLSSPRRRLSIGVELARKFSIEIPYKDILHPSFRNPEAQEDEKKLFRSLVSTNGVFITTNYDTWIDDYIAKGDTAHISADVDVSVTRRSLRMFCRPEDFSLSELGQPATVFHLHGSCTDPDTMVVTTRGYLELYADFDNEQVVTTKVRTFLQELFTKYVILFVGYGLEELELLEYVINKGRGAKTSSSKSQELRHFLLEGFYSHEQRMIAFLSDYYASQCDVSLVPFNKDKQGHRQLIDVMEAWSKSLRTEGLTEMEVIRDVERLSREIDV